MSGFVKNALGEATRLVEQSLRPGILASIERHGAANRLVVRAGDESWTFDGAEAVETYLPVVLWSLEGRPSGFEAYVRAVRDCLKAERQRAHASAPQAGSRRYHLSPEGLERRRAGIRAYWARRRAEAPHG